MGDSECNDVKCEMNEYSNKVPPYKQKKTKGIVIPDVSVELTSIWIDTLRWLKPGMESGSRGVRVP